MGKNLRGLKTSKGGGGGTPIVPNLDAVTTQGNVTDNDIVIGEVLGTKFYIQDGLSTEFLKADGSRDSNTYATESYSDGKVEDTIVDGVTTKAPSQNAVFDALALKQNSLGYTAENQANKTNTVVGNEASTSLYLSVKGVYDWVTGLFVQKNVAITGATKTKITYDAKGLVTSGTDATTADINDSTNRRYVTDAKLTVISNTSGTNTGDNATNTTSNSYADGKVEDAIVDGVTTKAPSQNAVFDALALKQNSLGYTAENQANKTNTVVGNEASTSLYLSVKGVYDWVTGLFVQKNTSITGATKTKITYDSKGLVISGTDATTADVNDSTNRRYVTDAQLTVIANTSGTNTGDHGLQIVTDLGNITTSTIETAGFKKTGGTSSEFLKADGSVDSNTYSSITGLSANHVPKFNGTNLVNSVIQENGTCALVPLSLPITDIDPAQGGVLPSALGYLNAPLLFLRSIKNESFNLYSPNTSRTSVIKSSDYSTSWSNIVHGNQYLFGPDGVEIGGGNTALFSQFWSNRSCLYKITAVAETGPQSIYLEAFIKIDGSGNISDLIITKPSNSLTTINIVIDSNKIKAITNTNHLKITYKQILSDRSDLYNSTSHYFRRFYSSDDNTTYDINVLPKIATDSRTAIESGLGSLRTNGLNAEWSDGVNYNRIEREQNIINQAGVYTILATDYIILCTSTSSFTLPSSAGLIGKTFIIYSNNFPLVLNRNGSDLINGAVSVSYTGYKKLEVRCLASGIWLTN